MAGRKVLKITRKSNKTPLFIKKNNEFSVLNEKNR